ncbi:hypothetical protein LINPERPRIM_LOCUS34601 [Linum perenne]
MSTPAASSKSFGSLQLKWKNKFARVSLTITIANEIPGQILLPAPNGVNSK